MYNLEFSVIHFYIFDAYYFINLYHLLSMLQKYFCLHIKLIILFKYTHHLLFKDSN